MRGNMSVQSVERTFAIIEFLADHTKPQQLAVIAKACGLAPATTHRLLETISELGYVKGEIGGFYSLTPRLFSMTSKSLTDNTLVSIAKPHLDDLSDLAGESVHLVLRDGCDVIYIYKALKSIGSLQMASHIGKRVPMYRTAVGKAILSTLPQTEIRQIFQKSDIRPITPNTITTIEGLLEHLDISREQGYFIDNEENEIGITCIALPLGKPQDGIRYAFSISSLTARMTPERLKELAKAMKRTQDSILKELVSI